LDFRRAEFECGTFDVGRSVFAFGEGKTSNAERQMRKRAGEGNRTPVCSLGSYRSTIELHPQRDLRF
jgi:hypothetical protein